MVSKAKGSETANEQRGPGQIVAVDFDAIVDEPLGPDYSARFDPTQPNLYISIQYIGLHDSTQLPVELTRIGRMI